jgi:transcriptional regulator with XRE-family HTH domain
MTTVLACFRKAFGEFLNRAYVWISDSGETMSNLASRLVKERLRMGLTPEHLSDLAGVTYFEQLDYEKGARSPDAGYLERIALQGADILYLLTGQRTVAVSASTPEYGIDPVVAAVLPTYVIEDTKRVLHLKLWETAEALSRISARSDSGQFRSPELLIAEHLAASDEKAERLEAFLQKPNSAPKSGLN